LFGNLKGLENLNIADNQISTILPPKSKFGSLKVLNMNRNRVNTWKEIHLLNSFPQLVEIRVAGNPVCEAVPITERSTILVGRLKNALRLNGSEINEKSRRDAECYYLTLAHKDLKLENFAELHPRYQELCALHGTPVDAKMETTVADRLIVVKLLHPETKELVEKKIPKQTIIRSFKTIVARTLWPTGWQKAIRGTLVWTTSGTGDVFLQDELKSLDFYGITNQDCFRIDY
jgi:hypothetical protein